MSEFQRWTSQHRTIRASQDWNALLDHGLEKPASYIIRKNGSYYEAINGSTGKIDYGGANNAGGVSGSDAAAVIQQAINVLAEGGTIFIKSGTYVINSKISLAPRIHLIGEGWATILQAGTDLNDHILDFSPEGAQAVVDVIISHLKIDGNKDNQTSEGRGINIEYQVGGGYPDPDPFLIVEDVFIVDTKGDGLAISPSGTPGVGSNQCMLKSIIVNDADGIGLNIRGADHRVLQCVVGNSKKHNFYINVGNTIVTNCVSYGAGKDTSSDYAGFYVYGSRMMFVNCYAQDDEQEGWYIQGDNLFFVNCYADNTNRDGTQFAQAIRMFNPRNVIWISGGIIQHATPSAGGMIIESNPRNVSIIGINISSVLYSGIIINSATDCVISDAQIYQTNVTNDAAPNNQCGILLQNCSRVTIIGCSISDVADGYMKYGIREDTANPSTDCSYIHNNVANIPNATTPIEATGSGDIIKGNIGYITENSGTAIIPANAKSCQVTFPMNIAPTVVKVTPSFDVSGRYWVSGLTYLGLIASGAYGPSGYYSRFTFNRTYSGLYSGIIYWNAEA